MPVLQSDGEHRIRDPTAYIAVVGRFSSTERRFWRDVGVGEKYFGAGLREMEFFGDGGEGIEGYWMGGMGSRGGMGVMPILLRGRALADVVQHRDEEIYLGGGGVHVRRSVWTNWKLEGDPERGLAFGRFAGKLQMAAGVHRASDGGRGKNSRGPLRQLSFAETRFQAAGASE